VHVKVRRLTSLTLVSTWPTGAQTLCATLGQALGQTCPGLAGQTVQCAVGLVMRTGPEEFMVISDPLGELAVDVAATLRQSISAEVGSVTNLSHARCCIHIDGPECLATLSKLFALDLRENAFPVHEIRLSGHHHVPCTLHRLGLTEFDLYVFSTYAYDQLATLLDAALEYGVGLSRME
jgi:sarcosine oxidase subunit gamma